MEEVNKLPIESKDWQECYKWTRIIEWISLGFSFYILIVLAGSIFVKFFSQDHFFLIIVYELWMNAWLFLLIFIIIYMKIEIEKIQPLQKKVREDLTKKLEDRFEELYINFPMFFGRHCSILVRPAPHEAIGIEIDEMDYYDFIEYIPH